MVTFGHWMGAETPVTAQMDTVAGMGFLLSLFGGFFGGSL